MTLTQTQNLRLNRTLNAVKVTTYVTKTKFLTRENETIILCTCRKSMNRRIRKVKIENK
jgi:hypothetical protein